MMRCSRLLILLVVLVVFADVATGWPKRQKKIELPDIELDLWPELTCHRYYYHTWRNTLLKEVNQVCRNFTDKSAERLKMEKEHNIMEYKGCILVELGALVFKDNRSWFDYKVLREKVDQMLYHEGITPFGNLVYYSSGLGRQEYVEYITNKTKDCDKYYIKVQKYPSYWWADFYRCIEDALACRTIFSHWFEFAWHKLFD